MGNTDAGVGGRAAVSETIRSATHRGSDNAVGVHLADATVVEVSKEQVAGGVEGHGYGIVNAGIGSRAAVAGVASDPAPGGSNARHRGDDVLQKIGAVELPLVDERAGLIDARAEGDTASSKVRQAGRLNRQ